MINRAGAVSRPIPIAVADLKASTAALNVPAGLNLTPWRSGSISSPGPLDAGYPPAAQHHAGEGGNPGFAFPGAIWGEISRIRGWLVGAFLEAFSSSWFAAGLIFPFRGVKILRE
jgi:hypothetical protein